MPYAPIYLPPGRSPTPAVLAAEREILDAEGPFHVGGSYYASARDADEQRRHLAERRVGDEERGAAWRRRWQARAAALLPVEDLPVATLLAPRERDAFDAAVGPRSILHRGSLDEVRHDLAHYRAGAVVVSSSVVHDEDAARLRAIVQAFPGVRVVALVFESSETRAIQSSALFGRVGIDRVIDCRTCAGWADLRSALDPQHSPDTFIRRALAAILAEIAAANGEVNDGVGRFFAAVFSPGGTSTKLIAARLGLKPSTLASRFYRAGLPSPRRYALAATLVWTAHLAENERVSFAAVAYRVGAASPQSLNRTIRTATGLSALAFRRSFTGAEMLHRFRATLVSSYLERLRSFDPLGGSVPLRAANRENADESPAEPGRAA